MRRADVVRPDPLAGGRGLVFGFVLGLALWGIGVALIVWAVKAS